MVNRRQWPTGRHLILLLSGFFFLTAGLNAQVSTPMDRAFPRVFGEDPPDLLAADLRAEAAYDSRLQQIPSTLQDWTVYREALKKAILLKAGVTRDPLLPLQVRETGHHHLNGYTVSNIWFQTRPGVYATANLYVPDGKGPFPAVINMHGHWPDGRMGEMVQGCGHSLAIHGYVCLNIDAFGSGERTTREGVEEYHGANLGASLLNIGETLLGDQLADNMRGVDLLCSLPYVDTTKIGATGASGGGNQTLWLAAVDERIKAAMPVVSIGTFEAYVLNSNCVCELLPDGLRLAEEAGVLGLIAPRALKIATALQETNTAFKSAEMLRSYHRVAPIFSLYDKSENLDTRLFNTGHGYWPEMRQALLGWMDWKLKGLGKGDPVQEVDFQLLPVQQLRVFPSGERDPRVEGIAAYCRRRGLELQQSLVLRLQKECNKTGRAGFAMQKRRELSRLLRLPELPAIRKIHQYPPENGWERIVLELPDRRLMPLLLHAPAAKHTHYTLIFRHDRDSLDPVLVKEQEEKGDGILLADGWGIGECSSPLASQVDGHLPPFHTLVRSELWLGKSVMGEWVTDLRILTRYFHQRFRTATLTLEASREMGVAALCMQALYPGGDSLILRDCPLSYVFDQREGIDYFNMAIHIPGFLPWGDIALAAALAGHPPVFVHPVSMSGQTLTRDALDSYHAFFHEISLIVSK